MGLHPNFAMHYFKQNLVPRRKSSPEELTDQVELYPSKPHNSHAALHCRNSSDASKPCYPARTSISPCRYSTAELLYTNANDICAGPITEWLLNLNNSAPPRTNALSAAKSLHLRTTARSSCAFW